MASFIGVGAFPMRALPCPGQPAPRHPHGHPRAPQRRALRVAALLDGDAAANQQSAADDGVVIPLNYAQVRSPAPPAPPRVLPRTPPAPHGAAAHTACASRPPRAPLQLLGFKGRDVSELQITGAYEDLLASELDPAFSTVARMGREKLLYAAREGLRSARGRLGAIHPNVSIEAVLLPGAMALLQQDRRYDLVAALARQAAAALAGRELRANSRATVRDYQRDVALAAALALCGGAKAALDGGSPAAACAGLEEAAAVLRGGAAGGAPLAGELQARIAAALRDLKPDAVLDVLQVRAAANVPAPSRDVRRAEL
jgi:hypothetical protein